jgi:hypothetical protein
MHEILIALTLSVSTLKPSVPIDTAVVMKPVYESHWRKAQRSGASSVGRGRTAEGALFGRHHTASI